MLNGSKAMRQRFDFIFDDEGQDVIEYALLTALIGVVAIAACIELVGRVGLVYSAADAGIQNLSSCTPDPGTSCAP
jgi:Flp pilus assembly pilin Flp